MGFFKDMFSTDRLLGRDPEIMTQPSVDTLKKSVADPLSKYLSKGIGEGVPRYDGKITGEYPESSLENAQKFMDIDPRSYFEQNIKTPAISQFQEQLAISKEDFAGQLSGSGRFRSEEQSINTFTRDLAGAQAEFEMGLPERQFAMANMIKKSNDLEAAAQYQDWFKSLPMYNPILDQALRFLSEGTSSGTTILSYLDQGSEGLLHDVLVAVAGGASSGGGGATTAPATPRN